MLECRQMDETLKAKILALLNNHRLMSLATNRPDGWPQVMTVGYVNDDLTLYFLCGTAAKRRKIWIGITGSP